MGDALPLHTLASEAPRGWRVQRWADGRAYVMAWAASPVSSPFAGFGWVMLVRTPLQVVNLAYAGLQRGIWTAAALAVLLATALAWLLSTLFLRLLGRYVEQGHRVAESAPVPALLWRLLAAELSRRDEVVQALVSRLPGQASCAGEPQGCPSGPHELRDPYANERRHRTESGAATQGAALLDNIEHARLRLSRDRPTRSKVVKDCLSPAVWTQRARKP